MGVLKICDGCGSAIYHTVGDFWAAHGGPLGGVCRPEDHVGETWEMTREHPHRPLDMADPQSVERWLAT